jgi:hypothetical protein
MSVAVAPLTYSVSAPRRRARLSFVLFQEAIGAVITGAPRADVVISSTYVAHLMTDRVGASIGLMLALLLAVETFAKLFP